MFTIDVTASNTPPPSPQPVQMYGTLKGLEQSMNPQLMKYARETDVSIALARRENRRRLFSVYPHMPVSILNFLLLRKNILIRRKESDTYLATVSRHRWNVQSSADEGHSAG